MLPDARLGTGDSFDGSRIWHLSFHPAKGVPRSVWMSDRMPEATILDDHTDLQFACDAGAGTPNSSCHAWKTRARVKEIPRLAMSLLTGKWTQETRSSQGDVRHSWDFVSGKQAEQLNQVEQVREILTADGRTLVQGALGWLWARSNHTIPIPSFKTVQQVQENAAALHFGPLNSQQMAEIEQLLGPHSSER